MMKFNQPTCTSARIGLVLAALFAAFSVQAQVSEAQVIEAGLTAPDARFSATDEQGRNVYLIEFTEPGLMDQHRQLRGTDEVFSLQAAPMQAALSALQVSQQQHIQSLDQVLGRSLEVSHHYLVTHSGIAARLTPAEARQVSELPGVALVEREKVYEIQTFRGPEFIGAGGLWDGSESPTGLPLEGEGMVAAILDTGIVTSHPSFANDPACGHGTGAVGDKLLSALDCASTDSAGMCNGPDPSDDHSHGSHVSGTVAGNRIDSSASPPPDAPISGVAPCAHVRSYRTCPGGSCPFAQTQAGMNSVLIHGDVDVMNYSISGGRSPWNDGDRRKLDLVDAGIFVAASAGNTNAAIPNPYGQVSHLGPWLMSVANSSHDGVIAHPLSLAGGPDDMAGLPGTGPALTTDYSAPLRWAGDVSGADEEGCSAFPPGSFNGEAALIIRGSCDFAAKVTNAYNAGATFVVIYNNAPGGPIVMGGQEGNAISSVMVSLDDGLALVDALDGGTATLTALAGLQGYGIPGAGDILSGGSLVGPTPAPLQNLQKPDITAPGTNIYAAGTGASGYTPMSGTSMSSPHLAGAAVLVHQARPDWSPVEVKSALQITASGGGFKPGGTNPWDADDVGHGRTQVSLAANAGLVMDETFDNFLAANPAGGSIDVQELNLAALRGVDCSPSCSFERTVRNTLDDPASWSVTSSFTTGDFLVDISPSNFSFTGDISETETLTITISPVDDQTDRIHFGELVFTEAGDGSPDLRWTMAMSGRAVLPPQAEITPDSFNFLIEQDGTDSVVLNIANHGEADLIYSIGEAAPTVELGGSRSARGGAGQPIALVVDQNTGQTSGVGAGGQSILWFNQFTPTSLQLPFTLEEIDLIEFPSTTFNTEPGDIYDVYVWSSPDGDPASGNEVLLASVTGEVYGATPSWVTIVLPDGGVPIDASMGDVLIGIVNRATRTDISPALGDVDVPSAGRSWIGFNFSGGPGDPPVFSQAGSFDLIDEFGLPRNWAIRGFGTGGAPCMAPSDVPWLSVTPDSGSVAGNDDADILIEIDMDGLGTGDFEAHLCIETNDPDLPIKVVPIGVEVTVSGGFPEADISPLSFDFEVPLNGADSDTLSIANLAATGGIDLDWNIHLASNNCASPGNVPWLSVVPDQGSTAGGDSSPVDVLLDADGLNAGNYTALLCISSNDLGNPAVDVPVSLEVLPQEPAELEISPTSVEFGEVWVGSQATEVVTVSNVAAVGAEALEIDQLTILVGAPAFAVSSTDCGTGLEPQQSCEIELSFAPDSIQSSYLGVLRIVADGQTINVNLDGSGVAPVDPIFEDRFETADGG